MRRKIELYINGALAGINDQALVLFNYSLTDLQKPTAVKNSYSKQITLPGTPANDAIFSQAYRLDRTNGSGFNAMQRTPFTIYNDQGEIVESGYLKLNKVNRSKGSHSYAVTLYGGLGSFFYALSYRDDGEKKTLADLRYRGGFLPLPAFDDELDFYITAANVLSFWSTLEAPDAPYHVIPKILNFAPCYEGFPEGDFDSKTAVATLASVGLPDNVTDDGKTYSSYQGGTVIKLADSLDEWTAKDLRSYLQRPVLNVSAMLRALADPDYNGGYTLDWSAVSASLEDLWLTLPPLTSFGGIEQVESEYTYTSTPPSGDAIMDFNAPSGAVIGATAECDITASVKFRANFGSTIGIGDNYWLYGQYDPEYDGIQYYYEHRYVWFLQFVAYDSVGVAVGGSNILVQAGPSDNSAYTETAEDLATLCNYAPIVETEYESASIIAFGDTGTNYLQSNTIERSFSVRGATRVVAVLTCFMLEDRYMTGDPNVYRYTIQGGTKLPVLIKTTPGGAPYDYNHDYLTATGVTLLSSSVSAAVRTPSQARSGALIKKADVLRTTYTPAEYLLSLGKTLGWLFLTDPTTKKVTILPRDDFFETGLDVIDLSDRIDRSQAIEVTPIRATSKWYDLKYKDGAGAFWTDYKERYGVTYGIQRVDTGYDFDSSPEDLLDACIFRAAVESLDYSRFWNQINHAGVKVPSVFLDSGHTYTLWDNEGKTKDFSVSRPSPTSTVTYYNNDHEGYDIAGSSKLQLKAADGKGVDGSDILVWLRGFQDYTGFKVSDDNAFMVALNDGKPCWDLDPATSTLRLPLFGRFIYDDDEVVKSIEFGDVRELAIPDVTLGDDSSLYAAKWRSYLRDLLDEDTKVLKCKVNLEGLAVGQDLLRRFFWYEGSLWVLNKINNYSLTTFDPAECEFVQVQDMDNYTDGQLW